VKTSNKGATKTAPGKQAADQVSELTTNRLSVYLRCLSTLEESGVRTISSQALAEQFHLNAAQIRKDLAYFGEFGVRGVGYDIHDLKKITRKEGIRIAVIAVPAPSAQHVLSLVVAAGIKAVLNFSPGALQVPPDVKLKSVDLTVSLESLSFFLAQEQGDGD
jgi:NADH/NAD ratio-sensing transcriptional regulator Rex